MTTTFDRARLRLSQPLPQAESAAPAFEPQEPDVTLADSVSAAFASGNLTLTAARAAKTRLSASQIPDRPDFRGTAGTFLRDQKDLNWLLKLSHEDSDVAHALSQMNSEEEVRFYAQAHLDGQDRLRKAFEHPIAGGLGLLAGAVIDLPSLIPGFGLVKGVATVVKGAGMARAVGASRLALMSGVESGVQAGLESETDLTMGKNDVLKWFGIGAAAGGVLGAAVPRAGMVTHIPAKRAPRPRALTSEMAGEAAGDLPGAVRLGDEAPEGLSAATTPSVPRDPRQDLPARGSSILRRILKHVPFSQKFTSPMQRTLNTVAEFGHLPAVQSLYRVMSKLVRFDVASRAEDALATARVGRSVQEEMGLLMHGRATLMEGHKQRYTKLQEDLLGDPFMSYSVRASRAARAAGEPSLPALMPGVNDNEFLWLADEWARKRHAGVTFDAFSESFLKEASPATRTKLEKHLSGAADAENKYWNDLGDELEKHGIITPEQRIKEVYRAQHYNIDNIHAHMEEFKQLIRDLMRFNPPDDFIAAQGFEGKLLSELAPQERQDVLDEWLEARREYFQAAADKRFTAAEAALEDAKKEGVEIALAKSREKVANLEKLADKHQKLLNKADNEKARAHHLENLRKTEEKLYNEKQVLAAAERASLDSEGLKAELAAVAHRAHARATRVAARKAANKIERAEAKVDSAEEKTRGGSVEEDAMALEKVVESIVDNILGRGKLGPNPHAFLRMEDTGIGTPGHAHPRQLDYTPMEAAVDPRLNKFLIRNPEILRNVWHRQLGSRLAFKKVFGTDDPTSMFDEIIKGLPAKLQDETRDDLHFLIGEFTGMNIAKQDPTMRAISNNVTAFNVMAMLGNVGVTLLGDTAGVFHARRVPQLSGVVKAFLGVGGMGPTRGLLKDLRGMGQNELAALIEGAELAIEDTFRSKSVWQLGESGMGKSLIEPNTTLWKTAKLAGGVRDMGTRALAQLTLMHHWSARMMRFTNLMLQVDLLKYAKMDWDKIPMSLRRGWATVGLGEAEVGRIRKLLDEHGTIKTPGGVELPNVNAWPAKQRENYVRAIREMGQTGIVNATPGSMPKMFRSPLGKMVGQFLSFPYAIQQKLIRPAMQHPTSALSQQSLLLAVLFGAVSDAARQHVNNRGDEWEESWKTPDGVAQRMYEILARSALSVTMATNFTDVASLAGGSTINTFLESNGLAPIIPEPSKLKQRSVDQAVLGPWATSMNRMFYLGVTLGEAAAGSDSAQERLPEQLERSLPFGNLIWLNILETTLSEEGE